MCAYVCDYRAELAGAVGLKGCVKGFQFQKKDFNLLEEPGTIGISSGCPEESFVSGISCTDIRIRCYFHCGTKHVCLIADVPEGCFQRRWIPGIYSKVFSFQQL